MKEIDISEETIERAKLMAADLGKLNNSIEHGGGNIAGFIGEIVCSEVMGGKLNNTYQYDLVLDDGRTVDVKTKRTSVRPREDYDCSIAAYNTKQECDMYAFVRVLNDYSKAWFLGCMDKADYFRRAQFMERGQVDPSNGFTVKANCYNVKIGELNS